MGVVAPVGMAVARLSDMDTVAKMPDGKKTVQAPAPVRPNGNGGNGGKGESGFASFFRRFASGTAAAVGSKWAFIGSLLLIVVWAAMGPVFHFSDTWQLVINTGTTIITFLV